MQKEKMDPKEIARLFRGPPMRTLFGRVIAPQGGISPGDDGRRAKAAEMIQYIVSRHYIVKEHRYDESGVYLQVNVDPESNEEMFDDIRIELRKMGMFPRIVKEGNKFFIVVFPLPNRKKGKGTLNLVLLITTVITTVWAGAILWMTRGREMDSAADIFTVLLNVKDVFMGGLTFAFPLLLILGTHELGHYFTSRRYRIDASLPYFIPIPPFISPIGTFGALISMKEPISNKKALVDIGAAGPIAGFIVAIPVTIIGLILTRSYPAGTGLIEGNTVMIINPPLLFHWFMSLIGVGGEGVLYPTAFAGWLGMFVTALNLLPVGQLDGGHIIRGVLGNNSRWVSTGTMVLMIILGIVTGFTTYIFFAVLILFLGARHPPPLNDISPLSSKQWITAGVSLLIMVLTFHPVPLEQMSIEEKGVDMVWEWKDHFASPLVPNYENITLENHGKGNKEISMGVEIEGVEIIPSITNRTLDVNRSGWGDIASRAFFIYRYEGWYVLLMGPKRFDVKGRSTIDVPLVLGCSTDRDFNDRVNVTVSFISGSERETNTSFVLVRSREFLELEQGTYEGLQVINGSLWNLGFAGGTTNISIVRGNGAGFGEFIFHPGNGGWISGSSSQVITTPGTMMYLGSVRWKGNGSVAVSAFFILELGKNQGKWSGEDINVFFRGPASQSGSRTLIVR